MTKRRDRRQTPVSSRAKLKSRTSWTQQRHFEYLATSLRTLANNDWGSHSSPSSSDSQGEPSRGLVKSRHRVLQPRSIGGADDCLPIPGGGWADDEGRDLREEGFLNHRFLLGLQAWEGERLLAALLQADTYFAEVRRMLFYVSPLILGYLWPTSTLLHGHLALATLSPPETDPQILEHWG